ncbi:MAG: hypothetical protein QGH45_10425 [Myxococcota bacterium]|nr:hypothetical protein [Myxococcota bacterium]
MDRRPRGAPDSPAARARQGSRRRWILPALAALLFHLLLLLWLPRMAVHSSWSPPQPADEPPIEVMLYEMSPDGEHDSRGAKPDDGEERQTLNEPERELPDPVEKIAGGEPDAPSTAPAEPSPAFSIADLTIDGSDSGAEPAVPLPLNLNIAPPQAANPATAPVGVCSQDYSLCVYDNGDVHEVHPSLAGAVGERVERGELVAVSDAELQGFREQFRQTPTAVDGADGMQVYRNYGRLAGRHDVDVDRLSRAASGAPRDCRIYPDALLFEEAQPAALYIVIDSSGSMNRNHYTSPATRCAWAAAKSALDHEIPVGVINFSEKLYIAEESEDEQYIAEVICKSQKKSTILPEAEFPGMVVDDGNRRDLLLISDGQIANLDAALPHLQSVLERHASNRGIALLINSAFHQTAQRPLQGIGFRVTLLRF